MRENLKFHALRQAHSSILDRLSLGNRATYFGFFGSHDSDRWRFELVVRLIADVRSESFASFWPATHHFRSTLKRRNTHDEQMFSALPPKTDSSLTSLEIRFVPQADSCIAASGAFHSITSSATVSMFGGTVRPSVFAVCRLMTNSNLIGCITGISAGFSPLRTRPV
jgi:hypothetical protein